MSDELPAAFSLSPVPARAAVPSEQRQATAAEVAPRSDVPFRDDPRVIGNSADDGGYLYYLHYTDFVSSPATTR
jgi:hypothetical protein